MKKLVAAGFLLVAGVELIALASPDRRWVLVMSGVAVACALLAVRWYLVREADVDPEEPRADDAAESLRRWLSRTETLISRAESTRTDWDRHLRPMLARQFEMATGQKRIQGPRGLSRHGPDAVRCGPVGVGRPRERRARRQWTSPVPAARRSTKFCNGWSGCDLARSNVTDTRAWATTTANCEAVLDEIGRVVVGKRGALTLILTTVLAGGHVLIEDLPGLGKTLIARSFAAALGLEFKRVQFTPDLLPADLLGSTVYDMQSGRFEFRPGPIFTNLLLADEINRTPPKTQAALLESMAEGQVSIDGVTHKLPAPFIVLATDNPIEYEGTYPLPEAQLDRFTIRLELRYLSEQEEASMLRRRIERGSAEPTVHQVVDAHELLAMRESVEQVTVHDDVLRYVVSLAAATRQHPQVAVGASPRAELDLVQLARARALLLGRDYVIPEDVKSLAVPSMAHRISLRPEMWVRRVHGSDVVEELLRRLPVPRTKRERAAGAVAAQ